MQFNWLLFLSVVAVAYSAVIPQGDIPVKVIYEREEAHRVYVRNLDKTQQDEVKQEIAAENIANPEVIKAEVVPTEVYSNALKNHDEKLQLSPEEVPDALRHLPKEPEEVSNEAEDTPKETVAKDTPAENIPVEDNEVKIVVPDEVPVAPVAPVLSSSPVALDQPQQPSGDDTFYDRIQEIVNNGVVKIKEDVKQTQEVIAPEIWTSFNDGVNDFLKSVKDRYSLRQASNNGSFLDQFSSFATNFLQGLPGQNQDTAQPSFPQNVVQAFQNGIGQIQNSLSSTFSGGQTTTVLGDATTPSSNPIQGFVQQLQTGVNNFLNPSSNPADENSSNNPIQNIQNSISSALGNFNLFNRPGAAAGDESSTQGGPFQAIQTAIQNLNPFQPSTTSKPSDTSSSNPIPTNPLGGDNPISSAIQQVTGGNNPIPSIPGNNPLQQIGSQVSNAISGATPGLSNTNNPVEGAINQISSAVGGGNNVPSIPNIPGSLSGSGNPLQGVATQITNAVGGNPLPTGTNPVEGLQGVAQQVASAVQGSIPAVPGS